MFYPDLWWNVAAGIGCALIKLTRGPPCVQFGPADPAAHSLRPSAPAAQLPVCGIQAVPHDPEEERPLRLGSLARALVVVHPPENRPLLWSASVRSKQKDQLRLGLGADAGASHHLVPDLVSGEKGHRAARQVSTPGWGHLRRVRVTARAELEDERPGSAAVQWFGHGAGQHGAPELTSTACDFKRGKVKKLNH